MRLARSFVTLTLLAVATQVSASSSAIPAELAAAANKMRTVQTLSARMHQQKELSALAEVVEHDGHFAFARPRKLVMDLEGAGGTRLVINGDTMAVHYKALGRTETMSLVRDARARAVAEHLFLLLEADPEALAKVYALEVIHKKPLAVRLTPLAEALGRFIQSVEARFDDAGFISQLTVNEANGDKTRWRFSSPHVNQPIADSRFALPSP